MTESPRRHPVLTGLLLLAVAGIGWLIFVQWHARTAPVAGGRGFGPAPVVVAPVDRAPITLRRIFSGELEARAEFVVAPKVGGRVERVMVNIADTVARGQVVATLDDAEYVQAVAQAGADLLVSQANLSEARSALEIADREFERTAALLKTGIASDSDADAVRKERLAKEARLEVARAEVAKARSSLETAKIRLGYTRVIAGWTGKDDRRVVAERYVDEGQTVAANTPLLSIVELDPIAGILFVGERDYARLAPGQAVSLTTDAYPDERFTGRIARIAPVFHRSTRQARIELTIDNPQHRLKPGMFIRAEVVLERLPEATVVPVGAITVRNDRDGVFVVGDDGRSVAWREVRTGIREKDRVAVEGEGLIGRRVVTLGQQLLDDGSAVTIPAEHSQTEADRR